MRWTRTTPLTNGTERGRRSRVVLTPRRWRQVLRPRQNDGDKKARSPGRSRRKPLKPLRAGMPGCSGEPTVTNSCALYPFRTRGCGCISTRHSPRPLTGGNDRHNSGRIAPRDRGRVWFYFRCGARRRDRCIGVGGWKAGLLRRFASHNDGGEVGLVRGAV